MRKIQKAVIACAGLGTRFLPFSKSIPKEMLPIIDKPVIQFIVEEMVASGIKVIIMVTSQGKTSLEDHFFSNVPLEQRLQKDKKIELLKSVRKISKLAKFIFVRQEQALGNGHALLQAEEAVGNEPFIFSDGDNIIDAETPVTKQLIQVYEKYGLEVMGTHPVQKKDVVKYGIADPGKSYDSSTRELRGVVEKPSVRETPSRWASLGMKYIFYPEFFSYLKKTKPGKGGEIWLVDALNEYVKARKFLVYSYQGTYYDCGNKLDVLRANIQLGLKHAEIGPLLKKYLRSLTLK